MNSTHQELARGPTVLQAVQARRAANINIKRDVTIEYRIKLLLNNCTDEVMDKDLSRGIYHIFSTKLNMRLWGDGRSKSIILKLVLTGTISRVTARTLAREIYVQSMIAKVIALPGHDRNLITYYLSPLDRPILCGAIKLIIIS
jgi:hypothetical protein